jgi:hypothetical protein
MRTLTITEETIQTLQADASSRFPVIGEDEILQVGDRINHRKFGPGSVSSIIQSDQGLEYKIKFDSPGLGTKLLVARYSPMVKTQQTAATQETN